MSDLEIGGSIKLNLNGTPWDWLVVHQGLPSAIYDASCNGTWLLLKDCYETRHWHRSDANTLENSTIHTYLNNTFHKKFDSNIQGAIKRVKIPYRKGGGSGGTDQSGANGLLTKSFLLSGYEVGFKASDSPYLPKDGAKLDYFESGSNTSARNKRVANLNGSATNWWLRSQDTSGTGTVWRVTTSGVCNRYNASNSYGIRPAIILPSDMLVTDDMLA